MAAYPRVRGTPLRYRPAAQAAALAGAVMAVGLAGTVVIGELGFLAPLLAVIAIGLLCRPALTTLLALSAVILAEGPSFTLTPFTDSLYTSLFKGLTIPDVLFILAIAGTAMKLLANGTPFTRPPRELAISMTLLGCAVSVGVIVGKSNGSDVFGLLAGFHWCLYFAILPLLILNLGLNRDQLRNVLYGAGALALVKALLGLAQLGAGGSSSVDGQTTLTYYEPTGNWLTMVAILWVLAALLGGHRIPRWLLLGSPLMLACLLLSYRRSFWIGVALAAAIVVMLGLSYLGRRLIVPTIALIAVVVALVGSYVLPSDSPIVERATTINPTSLSANKQDRYRLDERANVIANIRAHPITGIGLGRPWTAPARTMGLNHSRLYVHFGLLYWWLKLGILGLLWYLSVIAAGIVMSWRVWRRAHEPALRALGLASLAAMVGLVPIEMTATFAGQDPRFSLVLAAQLGLLAALVLKLREPPPREPEPGVR